MDEEIRRQAVSGAKWAGTNVIYATLVQVGTTAILARMLTPADFGLLQMMTILTTLFSFFADSGVSNAIIYAKASTKEELGTLYWLDLIIGAVFYVAILAICPLVVSIFNAPRIADHLPWLAMTFLILPLGRQCWILERKQLQFNLLHQIGMVSLTIASIFAIILAHLGAGVASLVWQIVISSGLQTIGWLFFGVRRGWRPLFYFNLKNVAWHLRFGSFQIGDRVVRFLSQQIDSMVIGRVLGPSALGVYSLGQGLAMLPSSKINRIIEDIAFPAFAKAQADDEMLRAGFTKIMRYLSALSIPMQLGLFITAPSLIPFIYGPKWADAVWILQILSFYGIVNTLSEPFGAIVLAKGRPDIGLLWYIFATATTFIAAIIGVNWGVAGAAWAALAASAGILWTAEFGLRWRLIRMKPSEYFACVKFPAFASAAMTFVVWIAGSLLISVPPAIGLTIQILTGVVSYVITSWMIDRRFVLEFIHNVTHRT